MSFFGWLQVIFFRLYLDLSGSRPLLLLKVRGGKVVLRSGRAPANMLIDLLDVVQRERVARAWIFVVVQGGAARCRSVGEISDGSLQMCRNVVGQFSLAQLRGAPKVRPLPVD